MPDCHMSDNRLVCIIKDAIWEKCHSFVDAHEIFSMLDLSATQESSSVKCILTGNYISDNL